MATIKSVSKLIKDGDWIESKDQSSEGIRLIQTGNIGIGKYLDKINRAKYISEETLERLNCTELMAGDILISRLPDPIGRACIVPNNLGRTITAVDCTIIRLDLKKCDTEYFVQYTQSELYQNRLAQFFAGSTRTRISRKNLEQIEIPLPDLENQKYIANNFKKIDELMSCRKEQLLKLDELVKARFVEMFGDPVTNEKNWPRLTLGDICEIGSSKRVFEKDYVPQGIPFFRTKEIVELSKGNSISTELFITEEHFAELKSAYGAPQKDDLLISAVGTIGTIWIVSGDFEFYFKDGNLIQIKASPNFNSFFMKYLLDVLIANYKKEMSTGTAYSALTIVGLKKMLVYDVPLALQEQFAAFIEQTERTKAEVQKSLDELEILKKSLMQKYFG